jgi:hypothetical protein
LGGAAARTAVAIACALAACTAQPLGPTHDAGLLSPIGQRPPPQGPAIDGGTLSGVSGGGTPAVSGGGGPPLSPGVGGAVGEPAGTPVALAPTTVLSPIKLATAAALAADSDGIYWLLADNQLWRLPTGADSPEELTVDSTGPPAMRTAYPGVLAVSGEDLFWVSKLSAGSGTYQTLHRTKKSGGDVVLVTNLELNSVQGVAVDDQYLYWTQNLLAGGGQILSLPRDAEPGTSPLPLATFPSPTEVVSLAVDDQYLYWTPWTSTDTTVYSAVVWRGAKTGLLAGTTAGASFVNLPASLMWPYGGSLYFVYGATATAVGRSDFAGGVAAFTLVPGSLAFFGDCIVSSAAVAGRSPQQGSIFAAPLTGGGVEVEIATGVALPAVVAAQGLVFVNATGELVAISPTDFRAALASGEQ